MNRPTKRQKRENPKSWLHSHSLACVADAEGGSSEPIRTEVASNHSKEVFLERLEKEIIRPFDLYRGKTAHRNTLKDNSPATEEATSIEVNRPPWPKQIIIGTNQCTRALEKAMAGEELAVKPGLVVLARDIYPPTILSHVPVMAKKIAQSNDGKGGGLPILLLPGRASKELGKAFGPKHVSIVVFLDNEAQSPQSGKDNANEKSEAQERIASFVKFVKKNLL